MADILVTPQALQSYALNGADIRHQIHAHPEEGLQLTHTQDIIVKTLQSFGCEEIHSQVGGPMLQGSSLSFEERKKVARSGFVPIATRCRLLKKQESLMQVKLRLACTPAVMTVT